MPKKKKAAPKTGRTVKVRGVTIGAGKPAVIVPVAAISQSQILEAAAAAAGVPHDMVEWRADWYEGWSDSVRLEKMGRALRESCGDVPILFTLRTSPEGGRSNIGAEAYRDLCMRIASSGIFDLLDAELSAGEETVTEIIGAARGAGVKVILSSHDVRGTPDREEILRRLLRMQELGADICKIAVMPRSPEDVLVLLGAAREMTAQYADRPVIAISMGELGMVSRLCGEIFGSAATFGTAGNSSAPGQIDAAELDRILRIVHPSEGDTESSEASGEGPEVSKASGVGRENPESTGSESDGYRKQLALEVIRRLKEEYPLAECTLDYRDAWQLLVSVRLAAQCTDVRVDMVTPKLYEKFPTVAALAAAEPSQIEEIVKPCGLGPSKARDISACMRVLHEKYGDQVPDTMEELLALPGVGRKSANLILGDVFGKPAIVTDTHCIRLSNLIGLVDGIREPAKVERALRRIIPPEEGNDLCHRFVHHGRAVCIARRPRCADCCLEDICRHASEADSGTESGAESEAKSGAEQ